MDIVEVNNVVEYLRKDTRLYLPSLTDVIGFSSSRIEYLLNSLVQEMQLDQCYIEIGVCKGMTLNAVSVGNKSKTIIAIDPCDKYKIKPSIPDNVIFYNKKWEDITPDEISLKAGVVFYDASHTSEDTENFMLDFTEFLTDGAILVLDDWDRISVRQGAFNAMAKTPKWRLLREMPEYTDGLTAKPNHFGYYFGVSIWQYNGR